MALVETCYFTQKIIDLKGFDMRIISAEIGLTSGVSELAPLSSWYVKISPRLIPFSAPLLFTLRFLQI